MARYAILRFEVSEDNPEEVDTCVEQDIDQVVADLIAPASWTYAEGAVIHDDGKTETWIYRRLH